MDRSEDFSPPVWRKRLTYVTTTRQNTTGRFASVGTVISAERLLDVRVVCPRCGAPAAAIWRRFDFLGRESPMYFTKCRRCHRRRPVGDDEAAFLLLEGGVTDPVQVLRDGVPAGTGPDSEDGQGPLSTRVDALSVGEAKQLVVNRQRAYGKRHALTFAARAQLGDALGESGDALGAARTFDQLLVDQLAAVGHQSPAVLTNRYRAAVWTAAAGHTSAALEALGRLLIDQRASLGPDHVNVLITRSTIAQLSEEAGDRDGAVELLREVVKDELRVLGSEHPVTEAAQRLLADWEG